MDAHLFNLPILATICRASVQLQALSSHGTDTTLVIFKHFTVVNQLTPLMLMASLVISRENNGKHLTLPG